MAGPNAVLLITGAWHVPEHYYKLIHELQSHGGKSHLRTPSNKQ